MNLLVLTGDFPDDNRVMEVISEASKEMERRKAKEQISIQFIPIGSCRALQTLLESIDDPHVLGTRFKQIVSTS